ncbi:hypothetical protein FQN49_007346 [Arthroderma sp. PD_2]|nr:hypothetical protein FQN49_007346 [Arthroderma sp. PD_2]
MQPLVGVFADHSKSKWGRRRPFMVGGSIIVCICLLILGWTTELVGLFVGNETTKKNITIVVAVLSIYAVDFSINVVQTCCRSLIVDTLPITQQQIGSAWAGRMVAAGHLIGYVIGAIDTPRILGTSLGNSQFKQMTVIAALSLLSSVLVTSYAVQERILISARGGESKLGAVQILSRLFRTALSLPPRIKAICWAQFWAWIGWFPFLFYGSTWVGETYFRHEAPKSDPQKSKDLLGDVGRLGSLSLVVFSLVTLTTSVLLPFGVRSTESQKNSFNLRVPIAVGRLLKRISVVRPDLETTWMVSHLIFAVTMIFAPLTRSVRFATFLVAICGIPWAVTCWAPFTFMGEEINRLGVPVTSRDPTVTMITSATYSRRQNAYSHVSRDRSASDVELDDGVLRLNHGYDAGDSDDESDEGGATNISTGELAGIYLGVLNVYTTLPQFLGSFISWAVFSILEPNTAAQRLTQPALAKDRTGADWMHINHDGPNAIGLRLFIGALSALLAAEATRRLRHVR